MLTLHLVGIMLAEKRLMGKGKRNHKESSPSLVLPSTMEGDGFEVILDSWIDWFNLSKGY